MTFSPFGSVKGKSTLNFVITIEALESSLKVEKIDDQ